MHGVGRLCSHGLAVRCRYGRICRLSAAGWTPLDMSLVVLVRQVYSVGLIDGYGVVLLDKSVKTGKIFPFLFFCVCNNAESDFRLDYLVRAKNGPKFIGELGVIAVVFPFC